METIVNRLLLGAVRSVSTVIVTRTLAVSDPHVMIAILSHTFYRVHFYTIRRAFVCLVLTDSLSVVIAIRIAFTAVYLINATSVIQTHLPLQPVHRRVTTPFVCQVDEMDVTIATRHKAGSLRG